MFTADAHLLAQVDAWLVAPLSRAAIVNRCRADGAALAGSRRARGLPGADRRLGSRNVGSESIVQTADSKQDDEKKKGVHTY